MWTLCLSTCSVPAMTNTYREVAATALASHCDVIANLGRVVACRTEGAFVHVTVEGEQWSPAQGVRNTHVTNLFLHASDTVIVLEGGLPL